MILPLRESQGNWEFVKKANGIEVRRRMSGGHATGEFKAVCETDSRIEAIGMVMADIPGQTKWVEYLEQSRVIQKMSEDHFIIYQYYDFIWPLYDRDCVAEVIIQRDYSKGMAHVRVQGIPWKDIPLGKRTVRLVKWDSEILLEYLSRNRTRITYTAEYNLGGTMPDWLEDILSREIPYRYLHQLVREARREEHQNAADTLIHGKKIEEAIREGRLKF